MSRMCKSVCIPRWFIKTHRYGS